VRGEKGRTQLRTFEWKKGNLEGEMSKKKPSQVKGARKDRQSLGHERKKKATAKGSLRENLYPCYFALKGEGETYSLNVS